MSGIFKSVKKVFKKIGKVVKKILPVLIVAAAVYFGGSYLMTTMGGGSAAAAGSAATSFTKSAGVWKSFMSGLGSGNASKNAVAFAEASYTASVGQNALPLSGQIAAGTTAVNAIGAGSTLKTAVGFGVEEATNLWQSGGDLPTAWQTLLGNTGALPSNTAQIAPVSQTTGPAVSQTGPAVSQTSPAVSQTTGQPDLSPGHQLSQFAPSVTPEGTLTPTDHGNTIGNMAQQSQSMFGLMNEQIKAGREDAATRHTERMAAMKMGWGIQGAGLLMSAWGQYQAGKADEEEKERVRNWKPSGNERYTGSGELMYPDGLLT